MKQSRYYRCWHFLALAAAVLFGLYAWRGELFIVVGILVVDAAAEYFLKRWDI